MNHEEQVQKVIAIGKAADRYLATYVATDIPRGNLAAMYAWSVITGIATMMRHLSLMGMSVSRLRSRINATSGTSKHLEVSEMMAWLHLANNSMPDLMAIRHAITAKLPDTEINKMMDKFYDSHVTRGHAILMQYVNAGRLAQITPVEDSDLNLNHEVLGVRF